MLAKSGRKSEEGERLIHVTSGVTIDTRYRGLTEHFSPYELQVRDSELLRLPLQASWEFKLCILP